MQRGPLTAINNIVSTGVFDANSTSYESIYLLLNADTEEERDDLTRRWRDHKLAELNFVGTVVSISSYAVASQLTRLEGALLAASISSAGSWPVILADERDRPWGVRVCLYGGLVFALFGVLVAGQQSMRLHRLSGHRDGLKHIRQGLARLEGPHGYEPYKFQVYAWGSSLYFLVASVICMVASITVLVWYSAGNSPDKDGDSEWWDDNAKVSAPRRMP